MKWVKGLILTAACMTVTLALAQQPTPDQRANRYRQSLMVLIGGNMGPMGAMAQDRMPYDVSVVERNAERIAFLTTMIADAFARDTRSADLETAALPEIWASMSDFRDMAEQTRSRAEALLRTARGGDEAATRQAIGALGGSCGDCHDAFRAE